MEGSRRRRCRIRTARPPCCDAGGRTYGVPTGLTNIHDLTDDLLELVLLHVRCRVTLARAAATCRSWRHLIFGAAFIRRFHSLHPPFVLGRYYAGRSTSFVPSPLPPGQGDTAAVDDVVISDRRVSSLNLDFLPRDYDTRSMVLTDCRGGLLAFVRYDSSVVVCDPMERQFREVLLPPTPPASSERFSPCLGAFLLDADAGDTVTSLSVSNFRVLCVLVVSDDDDDRLLTARAFVFSERDSRWLLLNSTALQPYTYRYSGSVKPYYSVFVGRMDGSLVWSVRSGKVIHLDESTGKFSIYALLPAGLPVDYDAYRDEYVYERWNLRVVGWDDHDGTGGVRLARIVDSDLEVLRCVPGSGGGAVVTVERAVNLSHLTSMEARPGPSSAWRFLEMDEAVAAERVVVSTGKECTWMFTVDVETMGLQRGRKSLRNWDYSRPAFPCELPWPPPIKM